jgi:ribosome biogenesis GTPase
MTLREFDEDDVRIRPKPSSRPRTKDRPNYSGAELARIISVDRGRSTAVLESSGQQITAMKSRELGKKSVVVGDVVRLVGDVSGNEGTLARIVSVEPRINQLTRTVEDDAGMERMIVSNVDQIGIVLAVANPEPRHGFVDRALVVAFDQGIKPLIIITKCDLADPMAFLEPYKSLGVDSIQIQRGADLTELRDKLAGKRTVLLGHSGVGKSTLVNSLVQSADRATGDVNQVTGRGRHTSSSALALELNEGGGWIIDTPGVRSFGLAHVERDRVIGAFTEFREAIEHCPKNCSHEEIDCALNTMITDVNALARLANLRGLLREGKLHS